jgi:hypothetical protein
MDWSGEAASCFNTSNGSRSHISVFRDAVQGSLSGAKFA